MAKRYPAKLKFQVVLELLQSDKTPGQVAKAYGIHPNTAGKWRQQFLEKGAEVFAQEGTIAEYERTFAWLGRYRRWSKDHVYLPETRDTLVYMAMSHIMVRRLARKASL